MRKLFLSIFVIIYAAPTYAQLKVAHGIGGKTCADFIAETQSEPIGSYFEKKLDGTNFYSAKYSYLQWVRGYITGYNFYNKDEIIMDTRNILEIELKNYCNSNPSHVFTMSADNFVKKYSK